MTAVVCPGCHQQIEQIEQTDDTIDIMRWGQRNPVRTIVTSTLYCPLCKRILAQYDTQL